MKVINLRDAFDEMWDFITDLPSGLDGFESDFDAAFEELKSVKSDDVVKVVRCRDCRWHCNCEIEHHGQFGPNSFCCAGERKED
jgi:hypothetical protein